jgi:hypothetical protein
MLLNEAGGRGLAANFRIGDFGNVCDDPFEDGKILVNRLLGAVEVVPDFGMRRVEAANCGDIATLDRFEKPVGDFERQILLGV